MHELFTTNFEISSFFLGAFDLALVFVRAVMGAALDTLGVLSQLAHDQGSSQAFDHQFLDLSGSFLESQLFFEVFDDEQVLDSHGIIERSVVPPILNQDVLVEEASFEEELDDGVVAFAASQMESCSFVVVALADGFIGSIFVALNDVIDGLLDLHEIASACVFEQHVVVVFSQWVNQAVSRNLELVQVKSLAHKLAELDSAGTVSKGIQGWRVSAETHDSWDHDDDTATDT